MRRREIPESWGMSDDDDYAPPEPNTRVLVGAGSQRPLTAIEALMSSLPCEDPDVSQEELLPLRDILVDALDDWLDPQERWIYEALFDRQLSLRQLERETNALYEAEKGSPNALFTRRMPRMTISRWRDRLLRKLREKLLAHPDIRRHLDGRGIRTELLGAPDDGASAERAARIMPEER